MHFYHPEFLYGLLALLIPLVIHLFNFKRFKKVYFANLSFLKEVHQQSKRHSQLLHLIILMLRMLFIAMLVIAFAGPYINKNNRSQKLNDEAYVNIFLDNSFSMQARASEGSVFDEGRNIARQIAMAHKPTDHFRLLNNDKISFAGNYVNRDAFLEQLDKIQIDKSSLYLSQIFKRLNDNSSINYKNEEVYIISDFQKKQADINNFKIDSNISVQFVTLKAARQGNIFVDSIWIEDPVLQPNKNIIVNCVIENYSNNFISDIPVVLKLGAKQKAIASVSIDKFSKAKTSFSFRIDTAANYGAQIVIEDYPIVYDDVFYFSFNVEKKLPILCIYGDDSNTDLHTYLNSDSTFGVDYVKEDKINYSTFQKYSSIILNGIEIFSTGLNIELLKYVSDGGNLVIIPNKTNSVKDLNNLAIKLKTSPITGIDSNKIQMYDIALESPEFSDVFDLPNNQKKLQDNINLPYFKSHFTVLKAGNYITLIKDETYAPILNKYELNSGSVFFFYTPIENDMSNFSTHSVFVPIFFNILQFQRSKNHLYYFLGTERKYETKLLGEGQEISLKMTRENDSVEFIPQYTYKPGKLSISFQQQPNEAGIYKLVNDTKDIATIGFNYNRNESYLEYFTENELNKLIKLNKLNNVKIINPELGEIREQIKEIKNGVSLWKLFIIIAISILIIELLLLRFSKL